MAGKFRYNRPIKAKSSKPFHRFETNMSDITLIILVFCAAVILGVIVYNMYQENKYRQQVREQFGHADKDALLGSKTDFVRDGKPLGGEAAEPVRTKDVSRPSQKAEEAEAIAQPAAPQAAKNDLFAEKVAAAAAAKPDAAIEVEEDDFVEPVLQPEAEKGEEAFAFERVDAPAPSQTRLQGKQKTLLHLNDLTKLELPWFDPRFDYMAYIALSEAQELHAIPRLSSRHRFQIAGCTMDDRFQIAEPIPSVYYQGFVIGLQAVSRNGLGHHARAGAIRRAGEFVCRKNECLAFAHRCGNLPQRGAAAG
jgi:hypothetical protein